MTHRASIDMGVLVFWVVVLSVLAGFWWWVLGNLWEAIDMLDIWDFASIFALCGTALLMVAVIRA